MGTPDQWVARDATYTIWDPDGEEYGESHKRVTAREYEAAAAAAMERAMEEKSNGGRGRR